MLPFAACQGARNPTNHSLPFTEYSLNEAFSRGSLFWSIAAARWIGKHYLYRDIFLDIYLWLKLVLSIAQLET